jgi:maleylacetoacetate isomerase
MALSIACDIHPLNNLRVLRYLQGPLAQTEAAVRSWYHHWIHEGFRALECFALQHSADGTRLYGRDVTMADICFIPQVYNARRYECDLSSYPTLLGIAAAVEQLPAFAAARPEIQPDAP